MTLEVSAETDFTLYDGRRHVLGASMLIKMFNVAKSAHLIRPRESLTVKSIKFKKKTLHVVAISFYLTFQQFSSLNNPLKPEEESKTKAIERISS